LAVARCANDPESNLAYLIGKSPKAWLLVVTAFPDESNSLDKLSRLDLDAIAEKLDRCFDLEAYSEFLLRTFYISQRARARQRKFT
jgi:hypothetical protein